MKNADALDTSSLPDPLEPILDSFMARVRRGERPSIKDFADRYPALADDIHELLPALVEMEQAAKAGGQPSPSLLDAVGSLRAATGRFAGSLAAVESDEADLKQLGDYKILRGIGGGGMGVVYEAERVTLRSRVVLKVIRPKFRDREDYLGLFLDEACAAASLHHTNIVTVFDYGQHNGIPFYAMQFIAGHSLDTVLVDVKRLEREAATDGLAGKSRHSALEQARSLEPTRDLASRPDPNLRTVSIGLLRGRFDSVPTVETTAAPLGEAVAARSSGDEASLETAAPYARSTEAEDEDDQPTEYSGLGTASGSSRSSSGFLRYQREIARIGAQVADALDYAHKRKVIHRDIKPQNILLDALGNPWITDFGLARLRRDEDAPDSFTLAGTVRYMSPERFHGDSDGRDDVYALGATLYELLALRPIFDGASALALIQKIENEPPVPLRQVDRRIHPDLAAIIAKALAKNPADRYQTAGALRDDLRRFIEGRPVGPRPRPAHSRFWLWCKRNPGLAAASIAAVVLTTALAIGSTIAAKVYRDGRESYAAYARELEKSEIQTAAYTRKLEKSESQTLAKLFEAKVSEARASRFSRQVGQRFGSLDALAEAVKIGRELQYSADKFGPLRDEAIASLMLPDLKPAGTPIPLPEAQTGFVFDDGMTRYAFRCHDGTLLVKRFGDDREIARFTAKGDPYLFLFAFSPDGKYLATRDGDTISVWDVDRKSLVWTVPGVCNDYYAARFSPDSRQIAVAPRDGTILMFDLATGQSRSWSGPADVQNLTFRPDGVEIAVVYHESPALCRILDARTGRQLRTISIPSNHAVAWSKDGSTLAFAGQVDLKIKLFSAARCEPGATQELPLSAAQWIAFHPAGTLLSSNSFDGVLRLWDPASGRERLSLMSAGWPAFSKDGRIFVYQGTEYRPWQVDPAVEYRTLRYASNRPLNHARASIHRDGRILAVGTDRGVVLWDLARKTELGFLPIGLAWHSEFEPSGDLITNGAAGVLRWAIQRDPTSGEACIGPPRVLLSQGTDCGIATDRTGRIVAVAGHQEAEVALDDGTTKKIAPLDDCRYISLSLDGKWLATGNHTNGGVTIWSLPDGVKMRRLPIEGWARPQFSPDGKWLVTTQAGPSRLWEVGSWREVGQIEGNFQSFSSDGRLGIVRDNSNVLKLVEIETSRILARLERPDQQPVTYVAFSPDGSRLVGTTNDPQSTQVIDLRAIRQGLAGMGLDWDAPAFPVVDAARADLPPLSPIKVDYGFLAPHIENSSESQEPLVAQFTERIKQNPDDFAAYHHRAHSLERLNRPAEAIADLSRAILLRPGEVHLLQSRARLYALTFGNWGPAIDDLEAALKLDPSGSPVRELLATCCNNLAWGLATNSRSSSDLARALKLSRRAVELEPGKQLFLNTRGVILYRVGQNAEAVTILEKSLEAGKGQYDGFDLFFLAMAYHRLGHRVDSRRCLDRAIEWTSRAGSLPSQHAKELAEFRAEAEAVLAGPTGELPDDVFEQPKAKNRPSPP